MYKNIGIAAGLIIVVVISFFVFSKNRMGKNNGISTVVDSKTRVITKEIDKQNIKSGNASPIVYFMELHKMDWTTLADYVGMWKWRIKRHAKPSVFKKLNNTILQKYADTFQISVEELKNYKGE